MKTNNTLLDKDIQTQQLALGFVGLGWIGRNRMQRLLENPNVSCAAIVEPVRENVEEVLSSVKDVKVLSSMDEMLSDDSITGVVIATPSAMHAEQTVAALNAGKTVFCQKPLGRNLAEVQEVIKASAANDKLLAVDLSYRYTEAFSKVHKLVTSGGIGKVYAVDLTFHNAYGPDKDWFFDIEKSGGGCLLDLGIHLLDLAMWTLDFPEINSIESNLYRAGKKLQKNELTVEDYATAMLTTDEGTSINLQCSWNVSAGREAVIEAKFYGTNGGAAFKNVNGSFYDFTAEKYSGTQTEILVSPPDNWGGRAGLVWAEAVTEGQGFDPISAKEHLQLAKIMDSIYGR